MRVLVIDDFLSDPQAERERALRAKYRTVSHNGVTYRGIAETEDPPMRERLEEIAGAGKAKECVSFWRRYLENEEQETFIHSDVLIGHFTAVLYLSDPAHCRGGLAFWRHRKYGWEWHPHPETLKEQGLKNTEKLWKRIHREGFDESLWEMVDYVPLEFNRLVVFRSPLYHSRYPKRAFGRGIRDARLIKTFFLKYGEIPKN